ncbi:MAG: KpsF/GutQ family sugar-phosphate isomerase [Pseudohongiellaceae bacterium]
MATNSRFLASARRTIEIEQKAVASLLDRLDENFELACRLMLDCSGRVVVTGMGKSGHIARKIAATLASTGTPAMYVHPGEAGHGDLGMITDRDLVIALSNSGTTSELLTLLPVLKRKGIPLITVTGDDNSILARESTVVLNARVDEEACPLGLAPTSSTTVALVLGDALAMALLESRGFTSEDFAVSHPGGNLGRRLLLKVRDIMHAGNDIPRVPVGTVLSKALLEITSKGFGMTTVTDSKGEICGVFTDGDLRRTLDAGKDIHQTLISDVMSKNYKSIGKEALAVEAAKIMQDCKIYALVVKDDAGSLVGILRMHDLLQANVV